MICRVGLSGHLGVPFCRVGLSLPLSLWGGRLPRAPARRSALPPPPCSHAPPTERRGCCARGRSLWAGSRGRRASRGWLHPSVSVGLGWLLSSVLVGLVGRWVFCFFLRGCCVVGCRHRLVAGLAPGSATFQRI